LKVLVSSQKNIFNSLKKLSDLKVISSKFQIGVGMKYIIVFSLMTKII